MMANDVSGGERSLDVALSDLHDWMQRRGGLVGGKALRLVSSSNSDEGRCVLSARDVSSGSVLVEIAFDMLVSYTTALHNADLVDFFTWCADNYTPVTRLDALHLLLIFERYATSADDEVFVLEINNSKSNQYISTG